MKLEVTLTEESIAKLKRSFKAPAKDDRLARMRDIVSELVGQIEDNDTALGTDVDNYHSVIDADVLNELEEKACRIMKEGK